MINSSDHARVCFNHRLATLLIMWYCMQWSWSNIAQSLGTRPLGKIKDCLVHPNLRFLDTNKGKLYYINIVQELRRTVIFISSNNPLKRPFHCRIIKCSQHRAFYYCGVYKTVRKVKSTHSSLNVIVPNHHSLPLCLNRHLRLICLFKGCPLSTSHLVVLYD